MICSKLLYPKVSGLFQIKYFIFLLLISITKIGYAFDLAYEVGSRLESATNITLVADDQALEENYQTSFLNVTLVEETGSILANVVSNINYINYETDEVYQDESLNALSAEITWRISPQRYSWYLLDRYSQVEIDSLDDVSVVNRQSVNEFISGPDFRWQFGRADAVVVNARAHSFDFDEDINDNDRLSSGISWLKYFTNNFIMNLNYDVISTKFRDDVNNTNYDRSNLFIGLNYTRGVSRLIVNAGVTEIIEESAVKPVRSELFNLTYSRQISNTSTFGLGYFETILDRSEVLTDGLTVLNGNFKEKNSSITYSRNSSSAQWGGEYHLINRSGLLADETEDERSFLVFINRTVGARTQLNLRVERIKSDYNNQGSILLSDDTEIIGLGFRTRLSPRLNFTIGGEERYRQSDSSIRNYSDNRLRLGLTYTSL